MEEMARNNSNNNINRNGGGECPPPPYSAVNGMGNESGMMKTGDGNGFVNGTGKKEIAVNVLDVEMDMGKDRK